MSQGYVKYIPSASHALRSDSSSYAIMATSALTASYGSLSGKLIGDVTGSLSGSSVKTKDLYSATGMYFQEGTDQWSFGPSQYVGGVALLRGSSNLLEITGSNGTLILGRNQTFANVNVGSPKLVLIGAANQPHIQPSILGTLGDEGYGGLYNIVGYDHRNVHIGFDCQFNGTTWNGASEATSSFLISKTTNSMSFLAGVPGNANDIVWIEAMNITGSGLVRMTGSVFGTSSVSTTSSYTPYSSTASYGLNITASNLKVLGSSSIDGLINLPNTTFSNKVGGLIAKGGNRFLHDYKAEGSNAYNTFLGTREPPCLTQLAAEITSTSAFLWAEPGV